MFKKLFKKQVKPAQKKQLIVHLGNAASNKTEKYAKRFPQFQFVGIDRQDLKTSLPNHSQIPHHFSKGLEQIKNNSADVISSEMSVGHYSSLGIEHSHGSKENPPGYTKKTIQKSYQKLKPGGKLFLVVAENVLDLVKDAIRHSRFKPEKVLIRPIKDNEIGRTHFMTHHRLGKTYQIIAEK